MPEKIDDRALLAALAGGSPAAGDELVRRHYRFVYGLAFRRTGHATTAAEIARQVFLNLTRQAEVAASSPVLKSWLHLQTGQLAAAARRSSTACAPSLRSEAGPFDSGLEEAFDRLGPRERDILFLHVFEQRSYHAVAAELSVPANEVRRKAAKALEKLEAGCALQGVTADARSIFDGLLSWTRLPDPEEPAGRSIDSPDVVELKKSPAAASRSSSRERDARKARPNPTVHF